MKRDGPGEKRNRRGRTALQMKRPGGKERAGGPKNRIQNILLEDLVKLKWRTCAKGYY